jgi:hypothetical protein
MNIQPDKYSTNVATDVLSNVTVFIIKLNSRFVTDTTYSK